MTEDEARTKWCPQVRQVNPRGESGGNRVGMSENKAAWHHSLCIASDCMMWVWVESITRNAAGQQIDETNYNTEGHCGLTNQ